MSIKFRIFHGERYVDLIEYVGENGIALNVHDAIAYLRMKYRATKVHQLGLA